MRSLVPALWWMFPVGVAIAAEPSPTAEAYKPLPNCGSLPPGSVAYSAVGMLAGSNETPNQLLPEERAQGWRLLFDGRSLNGWQAFQQPQIPRAWHIEDNAIVLQRGAESAPVGERGDIRTADTYTDFELRLQWSIAVGGNSGVFYRVREGVVDRIWQAAPEVQLLDDDRAEDRFLPSHRAGALYDLYAPTCNAVKAPGQYNDMRIIVRDNHVEHWLNGYRIVDYDIGSADWRARLAASKFRDLKQFAASREGYLGLQDHNEGVRFRSIRILTDPSHRN